MSLWKLNTNAKTFRKSRNNFEDLDIWQIYNNFSQILIVFLFVIFLNKFYIENIRSITKINIYIYFNFSNFLIYRSYSILNCKIKNVNKKFNELKFENLSMILLIFLFIENDIITSEINFLIYNSLMYFIIVKKNCFFYSIIYNIIINWYIHSIFFILFIINNMLLFNSLNFNFINLLFNIVYVIIDSSQYNYVNFNVFFYLFIFENSQTKFILLNI